MLSKNDEAMMRKIRVLYVEDEEDILRFASMVLEDYVDKLFIARNGKEALEILKKENIDLIITDILMPKISGIELIREIKKNPLCAFSLEFVSCILSVRSIVMSMKEMSIVF